VLAQIDVQVALKATGDLYIGYVKELLVGSAWKSNAQGLADAAMGAITTTDLFGLDSSVRPSRETVARTLCAS
jgi:hypothetical protein